TIASSVVGPIIPPSITMIIYAMQDQEVSVGSLFMAGVLPGALITVMVLLANARVSRVRDYASGAPMPSLGEIARVAFYAVPALSLILLIVGGIRFGIFTPTEASVIAVFYALIIGMFVYRSLKVRDLPGIILRAALTSSAVLLILGAARAFAWILIIEGIPQFLAETIIAWDLAPIAFLLAVNVLLLVFGLFMDPLPGVMILVPILAPISHALGIDPNHFAIVVIVNLTLGLTTPPVGSLIFVVSSTVNIKPSTLIREMPPFFIALAAALLAITLIPALSTWLPNISGF
ncbi:MAG: TRAP transporter large permease, partial [Pseudomonadota bacterium]|nr:TRAP transporter large permease [Pseudomonadota bacterium]